MKKVKSLKNTLLYITISILISIILYQANKKDIAIKEKIVYQDKECEKQQDGVIEQDIDNSIEELSDREAILKSKRELKLSRVDKNGVSIKWSVDTNSPDEYVKLIANLSKNDIQEKKIFKFKKAENRDEYQENIVAKRLTPDFIKLDNDNLDEVTSNLYLPEVGTDGSKIIWQSSNPNIVTNRGIVIRPSFNRDEERVTLTAIISKDGQEIGERSFTVTVLPDESEIREIKEE